MAKGKKRPTATAVQRAAATGLRIVHGTPEACLAWLREHGLQGSEARKRLALFVVVPGSEAKRAETSAHLLSRLRRPDLKRCAVYEIHDRTALLHATENMPEAAAERYRSRWAVLAEHGEEPVAIVHVADR